MTAQEQGFLLLTGFLGDPDRKPLTLPQLRDLTLRIRAAEKPSLDRELTYEDLTAIGYDRDSAKRILWLLSQEDLLNWYLDCGKAVGCFPLTRISPEYPRRLHKVLGPEAPGALWYKGDLSLLERPAISLVGSRELAPDNHDFAWEVGKQTALQGYVLVSGNARGADRTAQESCLAHEGQVVSIVADALERHDRQSGVLYLSEEGFDRPFSAGRALQRNRIIHALGEKVFVAQCRLGRGGTWDGTKKNLDRQWSPVFCFDDGSAAARELMHRGAAPITKEDLKDLTALSAGNTNLFDA